MAVRLTGMASGLDTDSIVKELVSAYQTKKEVYEKKQTKQEWTMDAWSTVNSKVYGFYSSSLSGMRFSSNYNSKAAAISNSSIATVSAASTAAIGTQSLSVTQLAKSGYLTGGKVTTESGDKLSAGSKLSALGIKDSGTISINGTSVDVSADMKVSEFVNALKKAGVNAQFDENNQRFFVSSKTSGVDSEFTLLAEDEGGLAALQAMKLFSVKDMDGNETAEVARYRELAGLTDEEKEAEIAALYDDAKYTLETYTDYLEGLVSSAESAINTATSAKATAQEKLDALTADDYDWSEDYDSEDEYNAAVTALEDQIAGYDETISEQQAIYDANNAILEGGEDAITEAMDAANAKIFSDIQSSYNSTASFAASIVSQIDAGTLTDDDSDTAAVRINAQNAEISLNGAKFTGSSNSFSINGLTINATGLTTTTDVNGNVIDNPVSITTSTDTQAIYDKIKSFITSYNEVISYMDKAYYADSAKGYEPLTDDEKEAMTDKQIEEWEEKIKNSLLRRDSTLSSVSSAIKNAMAKTYTVNGTNYSLATFGIATGNYFSTDAADRGVYHIDGDSDDAKSATNSDKLLAAITENPEDVIEFFQQVANSVYSELSKKMAASSLSSAYTIYNDKQMASQYSDYVDKVDDWDEKVTYYEDYYYSKFSAMEKALTELQAKQSQLSGLLGM